MSEAGLKQLGFACLSINNCLEKSCSLSNVIHCAFKKRVFVHVSIIIKLYCIVSFASTIKTIVLIIKLSVNSNYHLNKTYYWEI